MKNLEQDIATKISKDIAKQMDESILLSVLIDSGWYAVPYHFCNSDHAVDIMLWFENQTLKGDYKRLSGSFVFESKQDAEWFLLRWS